ncbi:tagaturonate reductase [Dyadobacter jejuensis]|uniref:Tagaturonate reductase n=1 Tax=Dyadobacter jejuensis TaxID=1082580 RepID=A0A316AMG9_9BACT|nr:tagaturonate reductase [Dyadobacter jejuensis]PWJ57990.1 tagaturonate reductase [Dyadobacter jejuensis]
MKYLSKNEVIQPAWLDYPEKVMFFGTGVLLRGLPLYFIDKANKQAVFQGRVVVVKSTAHGDISRYERQDNCFTTVVRGIEAGAAVEENIVNCAISRVFTAASDWDRIVAIGSSPDLTLVVSNTTEVGIAYQPERIGTDSPESFPAKLLAILLARYKAFEGDNDKGLVIVPTELISENGQKLRTILNQLAAYNELDEAFIAWLNDANFFCNSLVDRIVPGEIKGAFKEELERQFGYVDDLMIMAEPYRLWAIEGDHTVKEKLSFCQVDSGVKVVPSIAEFKELKLRLLNAPHTFCCSIAHLRGFETVKEAMKNANFVDFMSTLMTEEISQCLPDAIPAETITTFAATVLDRFRNESLEHKWLSISMNYTTKVRMRCVGLLEAWYAKHQSVPQHMAYAFAAYLRFMKVVKQEGEVYYGAVNGAFYPINDTEAAYFATIWADNELTTTERVDTILKNESLWGVDLLALPGFAETVSQNLQEIIEQPALIG